MKRLFSLLWPVLFSSAVHSTVYPLTIDSCGTAITFERAPQRAVIHDINMAEMAFALKLQDHIIGLTGITGWYKMTPEFSEQKGSIPELAPKDAAMETLLAVQPDFFFAGWNYGMKVGGEVTPEKLSQYAVPTMVLSESCTLVGSHRQKASLALLYNDQLTLGRIFDKEKEAQALVDGWKRQLKALPQRPEGIPPAQVFLYDSGEDKPFTSGRYAMPTALIEAAGGKNIMESLEAGWVSTSWEVVATAQPDFIILLDYQTGTGADSLRRFLESHPLMKLTPAVKQGRYIKLRYAELTPGPANVQAIEKLAQAMYGRKQ